MFCKMSWSNFVIWNSLGSAEIVWAFNTLRCHQEKRVQALHIVSGWEDGDIPWRVKDLQPHGTSLGLRVKGSIKSGEEKSLVWPSVRRETSSQIFPTWICRSQHIKTRNKLQWSMWDLQPSLRQDLLSPGDSDPAEVSFFLGFHRFGRCSALPDLDQCPWHLYQGSGPRNGSMWNQVSLERAHREVWRIQGKPYPGLTYPDPGLNWWPEQSQLCYQGMVYLHQFSLAVIFMTIQTSFLHWQVSKPLETQLAMFSLETWRFSAYIGWVLGRMLSLLSKTI